MIWFKYAVHEYMDEKPEIGFQLCESRESAQEWAREMTAAYSGGPTYIIGPATKAEILSYVERYDIELDDKLYANINNDAYYKDYQDYLEACENAEYPE
jgi:hypothetical protein